MILEEAIKRYFYAYAAEFKQQKTFMVACSGGPDSVGLVYGLLAYFKKSGQGFIIGHVNHGLRGRSSDQDEAFVKKLAKKIKIPCYCVKSAVDRKETGNLEEKARVKRYAALTSLAKEYCCQTILTAHTLDDQAETVLMNLARGTGPEGMGGMNPLKKFSTGIYLGRPLLDISKTDVLNYINKLNAPFCVDQSNFDLKLNRNWVRQAMIPMWELRYPELRKKIQSLSVLCRDDQVFWADRVKKIAQKLLTSRKSGKVLDLEKFLELDIATQRRLLRQIAGKDLLTFDAVERLCGWMNSPPSNGRLFQLRKGWQVERLSKTKGSPSAKHFMFTCVKKKSDQSLISMKNKKKGK